MIVFKRLTATKLNRIFLCFSEDLTATATARITGVNRNTVNRYFTGIREKIVRHSIAEYNELMNGIKAETLRFEAKTVLGKRLKRVLQERPILGLLRRGKKVFITVLEDFSHDNLLTRLQENLHERYAALYENETARTEAVSLNEYDQYRVWHAGAEQESGTDEQIVQQYIINNTKVPPDSPFAAAVPQTWQRMHSPSDSIETLTPSAFVLMDTMLHYLATVKELAI